MAAKTYYDYFAHLTNDKEVKVRAHSVTIDPTSYTFYNKAGRIIMAFNKDQVSYIERVDE